MPNLKDAIVKTLTRGHRTVFDLSKGRMAGGASGMPFVKLTTTGRKSAEPRHTMLFAPVHDDNRIVLVASYGGDDRHPTWYLNLREQPKVTVTMSGQQRDMIARTASAEEKAELWPAIVRSYQGYAGYQQTTVRDIPVVILEPA